MRHLLLLLLVFTTPSYATTYIGQFDGLYIVLLPTKCKVGNGQQAILAIPNYKPDQGCWTYNNNQFKIIYKDTHFTYQKHSFKLIKST